MIAQNGAVGIFSWVSGIIADRCGNRLAIRIQVFLCTMTPLMALFLISDFIYEGHKCFWLAFVFLGLVPVTMKTKSAIKPSTPRTIANAETMIRAMAGACT